MQIVQFAGENNNVIVKQKPHFACIIVFVPVCCKEIQFDYMLLYLTALHNTWKRISDFVKY